MAVFPLSKQEHKRISHSLFLQFLFQAKPFTVSDFIAVWGEFNKGDVYYHFGASH